MNGELLCIQEGTYEVFVYKSNLKQINNSYNITETKLLFTSTWGLILSLLFILSKTIQFIIRLN